MGNFMHDMCIVVNLNEEVFASFSLPKNVHRLNSNKATQSQFANISNNNWELVALLKTYLIIIGSWSH